MSDILLWEEHDYRTVFYGDISLGTIQNVLKTMSVPRNQRSLTALKSNPFSNKVKKLVLLVG